MDYSDKLTDFIDGELTPGEEREMFSALSYDDNLRTEYKSIVSMFNSIKSNINTYAPSEKMTMGVFSELGLSNAVPLPNKSNKIFSKNNIIPAAIGGIIAAIFTIAIMGFFFMPKAGKIFADSNANINPPNKEIASVPVITSESNSQTKPNHVKIKPVINLENPPEIEEPKEENMVPPALNLISFSNPKSSGKNCGTQAPSFYFNENFQPQQNILYQPLAQSSNFNPEFELEIKNATTWDLPSADNRFQSSNVLNNMTATLFMFLNDNFAVGAEIRQESFYMTFTDYGSTGKGNIQNIEQKPEITSYGVAAKFLPSKDNLFNPYIQTGVSFNSAGFVFRNELGFEIKPAEHLIFNIGAEYSRLTFQYKQNYFYSQKIGFFYGASYRF